MIHLLHLAGDVAVWVALVSAVSFCVTYALVAPWRSSAEGRHLMTFTGVIGIAFAWIAYRQTTGAPYVLPLGPVTETARAVILMALAGLLVQRYVLLVRAQTRRRKRR